MEGFGNFWATRKKRQPPVVLMQISPLHNNPVKAADPELHNTLKEAITEGALGMPQ